MLGAQENVSKYQVQGKKKKKENKTLSSKLPFLGKRQGKNRESLLQTLGARNFIDNFVRVPVWLPSQRPVVNSLVDIINS